MTTDVVATFRSSLDALDVAWTRTDVAGFGATLAAVVGSDRPAVGAPLRFDGPGDDERSLDDAYPDWVDTRPTSAALADAVTGVTAAAFAVADYGSVVVTHDGSGTEPVSLYPDRHVAVVRAADVVPDMPAAFDRLGPLLRDGATAVLATGPSATADMGALVRGAHGPADVHVVVLDGE